MVIAGYLDQQVGVRGEKLRMAPTQAISNNCALSMLFDRREKAGDPDAEKPDASIAFGRNVRRAAGDRGNIILRLFACLTKRKGGDRQVH